MSSHQYRYLRNYVTLSFSPVSLSLWLSLFLYVYECLSLSMYLPLSLSTNLQILFTRNSRGPRTTWTQRTAVSNALGWLLFTSRGIWAAVLHRKQLSILEGGRLLSFSFRGPQQRQLQLTDGSGYIRSVSTIATMFILLVLVVNEISRKSRELV